MLSDARNYLLTAWWAGVFPGVAIVATVLSVNVIGERLRDILDPRLRGL
jgi:peptide/nickel transport system permease protein